MENGGGVARVIVIISVLLCDSDLGGNGNSA